MQVDCFFGRGLFSQITQLCLVSLLYSFEIMVALNLGCIPRQASTLEVSHLLQEYSERSLSMPITLYTESARMGLQK